MSVSVALALAKKYANGGRVQPMTFHGIPISIENKKGTIREGVNSDGKSWSNKMAADYGYIKRTLGKDGDHVDVFVGPNKTSNKVFVIDQLHHSKVRFDEHKCLVGFNDKKQALTAYHKSYGRKYGAHHTVGGVTEMSLDAFKEWLKGGGGKKPISPDVPKYKRGGAAKATKATANYRLGTQAENCGICTMFEPPSSCTSVLGRIRRQDTCDYFEKAGKYQEGGGIKYTEPTPEDPIRYPYYESEPGPGAAPGVDLPQMVSDEDLSRAQIARATAPREGGLLQTIPQFTQMVQTPEGRSKLWEATKTAASEFIPGMIEQAKVPGEAMAGKITPEQEAEWGAGTALGMIGTGTQFARPGTVGIAGGRPPSGKPGPDAVQYWSQAIADELTNRHGNDYDAFNNALYGIAQKTSPRASDAIFAKLPEEVQRGIIERVPPAEAPPRAEAQVASPAFREITHPGEAQDWLRERGHDPKDWGYSDPENYVELANRMKRQEMGLAPPVEEPPLTGGIPPELPERATPSTKAEMPPPETRTAMIADSLDEFFGLVSPHEIEHLSLNELMSIRDKLTKVPQAYYYKTKYPETWNALHQRFDKVDNEGRSLKDMSWEELDRITDHSPVPPRIQGPTPTQAGPFEATYNPQGYERFTSYFNRILSPHFGDQAEFAKSFFGGMNTRGIAPRVGTDPHGSGAPAFEFSGYLYHPNGEQVGEIHRTIIPDKKYAYHGLFAVERKYQSGEVAPQILRNQIDLYKKLDLNYVELSAGLTSGPYSWAKYGWIPSKYSWDQTRRIMRSVVDDGLLKISDPDVKKYVLDVLDDKDPRSIWDIADIAAKDDYGNEIGRTLLLGRNTKGARNINFSTNSWTGQLNLKNQDSMERFDAYYKRQIEKARKKPKLVKG